VENAYCGERTQQSIKPSRMGCSQRGQFLDIARGTAQMVGDAESRGHMNRLTYLISIYQAQQVCVGSRFHRIALSGAQMIISLRFLGR
jgi:hypothetical protein